MVSSKLTFPRLEDARIRAGLSFFVAASPHIITASVAGLSICSCYFAWHLFFFSKEAATPQPLTTGLAMASEVPNEVWTQVCTNLDFKSLSKIRLTSKRFRDVAAEFMVKRVRFHLSPDSLDRLDKFANHPVFSKTIETVVLEGNMLADVCKHQYLAHFDLASHQEERPRAPPKDCTIREKRLFDRNLKKWETMTMQKWYRFQSEREKQHAVSGNRVLLNEKISQNMFKFPKLREISFTNTGQCRHELSGRFIEALFPQSMDCAMPMEPHPNCSYLVTLMLFDNRWNAVPNFNRLSVRLVTPSLFTDIPTSSLMSVFSRLKSVSIGFRCSKDQVFQLDGDPKSVYKRLVDDGIFHRALAVAKDLENLSIFFDDMGFFGSCVDMSKIMATSTWPKLRELHVDCMSANEDDFLAILLRQPLLTKFRVGFFHLTQGCWTDAVSRMRHDLSLQSFEAYGILEDNEQLHNMHHVDAEMYMEDLFEFSMADALDDYVCDHINDEDCNPNPLEMDFFEDLDTLRAEMDLDSDHEDWDMDLD